jgi:MshEN domain
MQTLTTLILERELASFDEMEAAIVHQVLHGGHIGTNLVELGTFKEPELQRMLSEYHELPVGPQGRLPKVSEELEELLPRSLGGRYQVVPVRLTEQTLHVAAAAPLDPGIEQELAEHSGMSIRVLVVTPLRLHEALWRWCRVLMTERERWLLDLLNAGRSPHRAAREDVRRRAAALFPDAAHYRRMSERPAGIGPSNRQPKPRRPTPPLGVHAVTRPDGLVEGTLSPGESRPSDIVDSSHAPISSEAASSSMAPGSDFPEGSNRITRPYAEGEGEDDDEELDGEDGDGEGKRDTQPWRDDHSEPDGPLSMPNEFRSSLGIGPTSDEAKISEEHRYFRHRGPFTRAQAELAVSQAPDVNLVLEILVRYARQFFERSILFVVNETQADLRLAYGLGIELASLTLPLELDGVLNEAFSDGDPVMRPLALDGIDAILRDKLGIHGDQRVSVIPLCIRERVVALFYGDDRAEGVDKVAVADVTDFTEICAAEVTRVIVSRKRPG